MGQVDLVGRGLVVQQEEQVYPDSQASPVLVLLDFLVSLAIAHQDGQDSLVILVFLVGLVLVSRVGQVTLAIQG